MVKFICYLISKKGEMLLKKFRGIFTAFILINIILLLASCTQTEKSYIKQNIESIITTFEHPETKQKFKIVNAYKLFDNYKDKVEGNPEQSKLEIYKEEVINPIYSDCFANAEYLYMAYRVLNAAPIVLKKLKK
ncbi:Zn-dependent protease OS=Lysinibacillus sphaericus OX=1421 GN=LS41612_16410 PE=4 SV=1 [Lysinibacillus sphaericus]